MFKAPEKKILKFDDKNIDFLVLTIANNYIFVYKISNCI